MVQNVFDTHSFLFTLQEDNKSVENFVIEYFISSDEIESIPIKSVVVGVSPLSCEITTIDDKQRTLKYLRIRKIFNSTGELVWDNSEDKLKNATVIGGY